MVQYAKNQPARFVNPISKVAIIGASGNVGKHMTQALLRTGKHTVTALTRIGSKSVLPEGVNKAPVDDPNEDLGRRPTAEAIVMSATGKAGVPWVMPTCYGTDIDNKKLMEENLTGALVYANIAAVEKNGLSWTLGDAIWSGRCAHLHVDVAAVPAGGGLPEDEQDADVTMERWRNRPLFIKSFVASLRDMLDSLHKVLDTTDKDWTVEQVDAQRRYDEGKKLLGGPEGYLGFSHCLYTRTFFENGGGDFSDKVVNEKLGLPEEDMEEATQRAKDMALSAGEFEYSKGAH
ncbi:hypothetical protein ARSEF1564_005133 [Beauveria bassiana]